MDEEARMRYVAEIFFFLLNPKPLMYSLCFSYNKLFQ